MLISCKASHARPPYTKIEPKKSQAETSYLCRMPPEVMQRILLHMNPETLPIVCRTSSMLYLAVMNRSLLINQICKLSYLPKHQQATREDLPDDVKDLHSQLVKTAHIKSYHLSGDYEVFDVSPERKHYKTAAFADNNKHLIEVLKSSNAERRTGEPIECEVRKRDITAERFRNDKFDSVFIKENVSHRMLLPENFTLSADGGFLALYFEKSKECFIYDLSDSHSKPVKLAFGASATEEETLNQVSFSRDNEMLVIAPEDGLAQVFSVSKPKSVPLDLPHECQVRCAVFSQDNKLVATGAADGCIRVWRIDKNSVNSSSVVKPALVPQQTFTASDESAVTSVAFSADSSLLVAGYDDGTVRIWWPGLTQASQPIPRDAADAADETGASSDFKQLCSDEIPIWSVQLSRTGQFVLATSNDGAIFLWNRFDSTAEPLNLGLIETPHGHEEKSFNPYYFACFSDDDQFVAAIDLTDTLRLWRFGPSTHPVRSTNI